MPLFNERRAMRNVAVSRARQFLTTCGLVLGLVSTAVAQLPATRLSAIFPPGAQVGSSVEVTITSGVELEDLTTLLFNEPGITATPKMQDVGGKLVPVPNVFLVSVGSDVPPGQYEVRTSGFFGVSNPRFFIVGARKELSEVEPNNAREQAVVVEINQTVNARINGGADVDWYKFAGKAGQRLMIDCMAKRLDSKLDAALELYNTAGKRLDFARRNLVSLDPLIDFSVPADGEYFVKVYDFTYAGGEDYPYRLSLSAGPYIDYVLPAAGFPGSNAQYTLYGRNLPGGKPAGISLRGHPLEKLAVSITLPSSIDLLDPKVKLEPYSAGLDATPFSLESSAGPSNTVMIQLSDFVPVLEIEPNDKGSQAQTIVVPGEVDGQFQSKGDVDCFQFDAHAKDSFWVEVVAHRAGAAIDAVLVIDQVKINDKGEEMLTRISALDDDPTNPLANLFDTLNDDNTVKFVAPADGKYRVTMRERFGNSKQDLGVYRLIVRKESPDFRVVAVPTALIAPGPRQSAPSGINLRRGDNFPVNLLAIRRDGFAGPITVTAEGLPPGVTCRDVTLGAAPSSGVIVFSSAEDAPAWTGTIKLVAKARIDSPPAVAALDAAVAAEKAASDAFVAATTAFAKPNEDLVKANEAAAAAKAELAANPNDAALKQKVVDLDAKVTAAAAAQQPLAAARTAAEQKLNIARAAVQRATATKDAAARQVSHVARYGTVVWGAAQPNIPGDVRVAQAIELSVMEEPAPYQLTTDVYRVDANHSRQILVPIKIARRNGFDAPVNLTFLGQPPNAQIENKPIPKEKTEELVRIFIPPNAPPGTYVTFLTGQAAVSYRKNPAKADRAQAELTAADQAANAAAEALKAATAAKDAAVKKASDDQANVKKLVDAKLQSEKNLAEAQNNEKAAGELVKNAGDNPDLKAAAEKKLADAQAATKAATEAFAAAEKSRSEAEIAAKQAEDAKVKAEAEAVAADNASKAAAAVKAAADQKFKAADAYAKAANINFHPTSPPIIITVKPAPYTVAATPADGGSLKAGAKLEIKCEIKRQNGFAGPVTLSLPVPPTSVGVKAEPVVIAAEQSTASLTVEAAADAPEAALVNMVVRASAQWDGEAAVDQPITLKVVK